jgi:two-component system response regulator AtoC
MGPHGYASFPLPATGSLLIGRDEGAEIRIADENASRRHARLHLGTELAVEDLSTRNGTFVRETRLDPGEVVPLQPGEAFTVGYTIFMVQRKRPSWQHRRLRSHGTFEDRLEEVCERAAVSGANLAVLRVHADERRAAGPPCAPELLAAGLGPHDLLAAYAPGEYEVLVIDVEPARARALRDDLVARLQAGGLVARAGLALFPQEGRSGPALISRAAAALHGDAAEAQAIDAATASPAMKALYELAGRAAASDINVLILGETGSGKEVLAGWIHRRSPRSRGPYVCINCAALAESLLESELFGHVKGAFTGANADRPGLLETARGGTVFLDEIGDMPRPLQTRLLRAIENRQITRVGSARPIELDIRFVAATNRDLEDAVADKTFRQDLFFRLNGISLTLPPLRERPEDLEDLARTFLISASRKPKRRVPTLSQDAAVLMQGYAWPGNVRELRNTMERALLLCDGGEIRPEHLPVERMRRLRRGDVSGARFEGPEPGPPLDARRAAERARIMDALTRHAGNQSRAAKYLAMPRGTFLRRVAEYGIARPHQRRPH